MAGFVGIRNELHASCQKVLRVRIETIRGPHRPVLRPDPCEPFPADPSPDLLDSPGQLAERPAHLIRMRPSHVEAARFVAHDPPPDTFYVSGDGSTPWSLLGQQPQQDPKSSKR